MYIEWREENLSIRPFLLYFQELFISSFSREYYFSKANITSATKLKDMFSEYEINPFRYIFVCFNSFRDEVLETGFRYFNSIKYKNKFIGIVLSKQTFEFPKEMSAYNKIRSDLLYILDKNKEQTPNKILLIDELINGTHFCLETLIYLLQIGYLDYEEYKEMLSFFEKSQSQTQKVSLMIKRGILPQTLPEIMINKNLEEWSNNGQKNNDTTAKGMGNKSTK